MHTEDHPLSYLDFEGAIPEGSYGAGAMTVWDRGTYDCHKWSDREVMVTLAGSRARGRYVLFRTGGTQWMLHRMDPPEDPAREPFPDDLRPMAVTNGPLAPNEEEWSYEAALGGRRVLVASEDGRVRVVDEAGVDVTRQWPELRNLGLALGAIAVVIEGELMVSDPDGPPDPSAVERRAHATTPAALARAARARPAVLLIADMVWLEGHATTGLPFAQRRRLLERLELSGPAWQTTPTHPGEGSALLAASRAHGLAGVVGRRIDAGYEPGAIRFTSV